MVERVGAFLLLGRRFILCPSFRSVRGHIFDIKGFRYHIGNQVRSPNLKWFFGLFEINSNLDLLAGIRQQRKIPEILNEQFTPKEKLFTYRHVVPKPFPVGYKIIEVFEDVMQGLSSS